MKKRGVSLFFMLLIVGVLVFSVVVKAHGEEDEEEMSPGMDSSSQWADPFFYIKWTAIYLGLVVIGLLFWGRCLSCNAQKWVFWLIVLPIIFATLYLAGNTVYENISSLTKGPVHWHADYQVWVCGERINLFDPTGFSNRIGTAVLHEHNDDRIHIEGTVKKLEDVSFGEFFETIGGQIHRDHMSYPSTKGEVSYSNNDPCPNGSPGTLKMYVDGNKIDDPNAFVPLPETNVPPGNCIIVEFSEGDAPSTDKLCDSWDVQGWNYQNMAEKRKLHMNEESDEEIG